jgi:hypothetical protein
MSTLETIARQPQKSLKLFGKGELPVAEAALLKRVIALLFELRSLQRARSGLARTKREICSKRKELRAILTAQISHSRSIRKANCAASQADSLF